MFTPLGVWGGVCIIRGVSGIISVEDCRGVFGGVGVGDCCGVRVISGVFVAIFNEISICSSVGVIFSFEACFLMKVSCESIRSLRVAGGVRVVGDENFLGLAESRLNCSRTLIAAPISSSFLDSC